MAHTIEKEPVQPMMVTAIHDGCGGRLEYTGEAKTSNPPWYVHRCAKCGAFEDILAKSYPRIEYQ